MDVYFYVSASDRHSIPLGLYERHSYLPYFALLGIGLITIIWVIYANTQEPPKTDLPFLAISSGPVCTWQFAD